MNNMPQFKEIYHKVERDVLLIFSIFYITMFAISIMASSPLAVPVVLVIALGGSWTLYLTQIGGDNGRAMLTVFFIYGSLVVLSTVMDNQLLLWLAFLFVTIVTACYGMPQIMILPTIAAVVMIVIQCAVTHRVTFSSTTETAHTLLTYLFVFFSIGTLAFWNIKKNESQQAMGNAFRKLASAQRSREAFIVHMNHELRTPIYDVCDLCRTMQEEDDLSQVRHQLDTVYDSGRYLLAMLGDVIDYSAYYADRLVLEREPYAFAEVMTEIMQLLRLFQTNSKHDIQIVVDCDASIPGVLIGDSGRIVRVIANVLNNAVKYTVKGGVVLRITRSQEKDGICLLVSITDTGIGMDSDTLSGVEQSFRQNQQKASVHEGRGMGLIMANTLVSMMGGSLHIQSKEGRGTTVSLVIPQGVAEIAPVKETDFEGKVICHLEAKAQKSPLIREAYQRLCEHMSVQIQVPFCFCDNIQQVEKEFKGSMPFGLLTTIKQYETHKDYFRHFLKDSKMIVVCDPSEEQRITDGNVLVIHPPINTYEIIDKLNQNIIISGEGPEGQDDMLQHPEGFAIGGLDTDLGSTYCGGRELYLEVLRQYAQRGSHNWVRIRQLFEEQDWANYTIEVHGIKSSMLAIGARKLSEMAQKLEHAGQQMDVTYILSHHQIMLQQFVADIHSIQTYFRIPLSPLEEVSESTVITMSFEELSDEKVKEIAQELEDAAYGLDGEKMLQCLTDIEHCGYHGQGFYEIAKEAERKVQSDDYLSALDLILSQIQS